jgi:hypothetical protein
MIQILFRPPRTVWLLGLVSLFNDSANKLIYPLVPARCGRFLPI